MLNWGVKTADFDYALPRELIAQTPIEPRDSARLMVLDRKTETVYRRLFTNVTEYLHAGDVLVLNDSRVIPARLAGRKAGTGGKLEVLLLCREKPGTWEALVKGKAPPGTHIRLDGRGIESEVEAIVSGEKPGGIKVIAFSDESRLAGIGAIALPPYIHTPLASPERYQTVYSHAPGSVAAPTAGLHFTPELLGRIQEMGVQRLFVTLHVGLDSFRPIREEDPADHQMHREYGTISRETAQELARARQTGRRIVSVGTTTARLLEAATPKVESDDGLPFSGWVDLFIRPGYRFRVTDALVTNFHLPRSTLLMLVSAFAGTELIKRAYNEAIAESYRFYSFGDAMLIF